MADEAGDTWRWVELNELDLIWNRAADYGADGEAPEGTTAGIVQLSYVLRVVNSIEGGGLGFAVEVNEDFRLNRAIDAMRYLGLAELADLLNDVIRHGSGDAYAEDRFYTLLGPKGDALDRAFRAKAAEAPSDFGLQSCDPASESA